MFKKQASIFLLFVMLATVFQSAMHHGFEHDEDSDSCEYCLLIEQTQPSQIKTFSNVAHDSLLHAVYVYEEGLQYSAFAKASVLANTLSIRPPPAVI